MSLLRTALWSCLGCLALPLTAATSLADASASAPEGEKPIVFVSNAGDETEAFAGHFEVPEYRGDPESRRITLRYVRFPSTAEKPGNPLVYLAGGPGGSGIGTAKWRRFPLFMAMRAHGDVIALDQRGTGDSDAPPDCTSSEILPAVSRVTDEEFADRHRRAVRECAGFWKERGTDLRGYTTLESVQDLRDLRQHLEAEKLSLWGISYGSHLALAAMKQMPDELDRVIIASVEGLDQTVKLPSRTDSYLLRVGEVLGYEDLPGLMRRVHTRVENESITLNLNADEGSVPYVLHRRDLQMMSSAAIADPSWAARLAELYVAADTGDFAPMEALLARFLYPGKSITLRAMPTAMDRASGVSEARLTRVEREASSSILGTYLNFPMPQILPELRELDLGDGFRADPRSDLPTLVLTGTLDGRTYPESQREATQGLTNAIHVTVEGAGHNLFMASPEVGEIMGRFLAGESVDTRVIEADN